jgi:hypothetical protein
MQVPERKSSGVIEEKEEVVRGESVFSVGNAEDAGKETT